MQELTWLNIPAIFTKLFLLRERDFMLRHVHLHRCYIQEPFLITEKYMQQKNKQKKPLQTEAAKHLHAPPTAVHDLY